MFSGEVSRWSRPCNQRPSSVNGPTFQVGGVGIDGGVVLQIQRVIKRAICGEIQAPSICSAQDYLVGEASGRQILRERANI